MYLEDQHKIINQLIQKSPEMVSIEIMNTLIGSQISFGNILEVKELTLPLLSSLGLRPNRVTYELMIQFYFRKNQFESVLEIEGKISD